MRTCLCRIVGLLIAISLCMAPIGVDAASGMPGSPKFGYGARLNIYGTQVEEAVQTAGNLDLDWMAVDFDWGTLWPEASTSPNWSALDEILSLAEDQQLSVLVSISNLPGWAHTPEGPDPSLIAYLTQELASRYPKTVLALELFPGANTTQGWGGQPNPKAYAALLKTVYTALADMHSGITLVAAGLTPITETGTSSDMDDLAFLKALYAEGVAQFMPVVGMRLPEISITPTVSPKEAVEITLRHYEAVRQIMLQNNHQSGLIWVTGFWWNAQTIPSRVDQAVWLKQAYLMMRAQLYIGAAFFQDLNPLSTTGSTHSLILSNAILHPATNTLRQLIALENSHQTVTFNMTLLKSARFKLDKKPLLP